MNKYSATTDRVYPVKLLSKYSDLPGDLVDITSSESEIYFGNIQPPEGMQRKKHCYPFEFEAIPLPSTEELFSAEMNALNVAYDKAMTDLSTEYNIAVARDGSTETEKVTYIRGKITALDGKYETDQLAIINKHYGV